MDDERPQRRRSSPRLPAAVITDQEAPVARVVPRGAKLRKFREATVGYDHEPAKKGFWSRNAQRLAELERLRAHRATITIEDGVVFAATDAEFMTTAMPDLLIEKGRPGRPPYRQTPVAWAAEILPSLAAAKSPGWFDALEQACRAAHRNPKPLRADTVAKILGVTWEERKALGLFTIGAVDIDKKRRAVIRKEEDALYQKRRRQAFGAQPRETSNARLRPWDGEGIGKTAWYRREKARRTSSSATSRTSSSATFIADRTVSSATLAAELGRKGTSSSATFVARGTSSSALTPKGFMPHDEPVHGARKPARKKSLKGTPSGVRPAGEANPPTASRDAEMFGPDIRAEIPQAADARQLSLLPPPQPVDELRAALDAWSSGPMPDAVKIAYVAAKRRRAARQIDVAEAIGISRPQLANALSNTFNLSDLVIGRLKAWLIIPDDPRPDTQDPSATGEPTQQPRQGKRPRGQSGLGLRLFRVLESAPATPPGPLAAPKAESERPTLDRPGRTPVAHVGAGSQLPRPRSALRSLFGTTSEPAPKRFGTSARTGFYRRSTTETVTETVTDSVGHSPEPILLPSPPEFAPRGRRFRNRRVYR